MMKLTSLLLLMQSYWVHKVTGQRYSDCSIYTAKVQLEKQGNLALGKPVTHFPGPTAADVTALAVDGDPETMVQIDLESDYWIEVDLKQNYSIGVIRVYMLPNYNDKELSLSFSVDNQACFQFQGTLPYEVLEVQCSKPITGSRVRMRRKSKEKNIFNIVCEFQVFEKRVDRKERFISFCIEQLNLFASNSTMQNVQIQQNCRQLVTSNCSQLVPTLGKPVLATLKTENPFAQCMGFCKHIMRFACRQEVGQAYCTKFLCSVFAYQYSNRFDYCYYYNLGYLQTFRFESDENVRSKSSQFCRSLYIHKRLSGACIEYLSVLLQNETGQVFNQCKSFSNCIGGSVEVSKKRSMQEKGLSKQALCLGLFKGAHQRNCTIARIEAIEKEQRHFCQAQFNRSGNLFEECLAFQLGLSILSEKKALGSSIDDCKSKHPAEYEKYMEKFNFIQRKTESTKEFDPEMKRDLYIIGLIIGFIAVMLICIGVYKKMKCYNATNSSTTNQESAAVTAASQQIDQQIEMNEEAPSADAVNKSSPHGEQVQSTLPDVQV